MDPERTADSESQPEENWESGGHEGTGKSSGDLLTMSLFGVMVIIASICFVIW